MKRGRPPKARGGLPHVLFVRADDALVRRLHAALDARRATAPETAMADVVRDMIRKGLDS